LDSGAGKVEAASRRFLARRAWSSGQSGGTPLLLCTYPVTMVDLALAEHLVVNLVELVWIRRVT
ncbi:MAG: hypothetical protein O2901_16530, partial [Verrucomicrobia bacterium]|nr:hypothetical protein [Verrucomicrobiota bacterium]